jgi:hypothetical protein
MYLIDFNTGCFAFLSLGLVLALPDSSIRERVDSSTICRRVTWFPLTVFFISNRILRTIIICIARLFSVGRLGSILLVQGQRDRKHCDHRD